MLSKNTVKFIKSLQQKKFRKQENSFFVEGNKNVTELLGSDFKVTHLLYTTKYAESHADLLQIADAQLFEVTPSQLGTIGSFLTNDSALGVASANMN